MKELNGKTAVVTGAASGIGEALAAAFVEAGMHVALADIELEKARAAAERLRAPSARCVGMEVDVASAESVNALAERCFAEFGSVHVLCNNAGVLLMGERAEMTPEDWSWTFSVNIMGVAYGLSAFVPRMLAQAEPGHVVNTASVTGLIGQADMTIYSATKAAVLSISESLRVELAGSLVGVSVLLPSNIRSDIVGSQRNRPRGSGRHHEQSVDPAVAARHGLDPAGVGIRVREGIERGDFYIFAMPASGAPRQREVIERRSRELLAALETGILEDTV